MTLRAYRPNEPQQGQQQGQPGFNNPQGFHTGQDEWQDTLLDRGTPHARTRHVSYQGPARSRLWLWTALFAVAAILITAYFVIDGRSDGGAIPLVPTESTAYKTQPEQPGGQDIPYQDKLIFNRLDPNGQPVQAEKLLPPPEEPMAAAPAAKTAPIMVEPKSTTTTATTTTATTVPVTPTVVPQAAVPTTAPAPAAAPVEAVATAPVTQTATTTTKTSVQPTTTAVTEETVATPIEEMPEVVAAAPVAKPAPIATTTSTRAAAGQSRIQLASIPDQGNAQKAVGKFTSQYGSALGSAKLTVVRADIPGKGTYWRVQSQPLSRAAAESTCSAIKAQGGTCILAK